MSWTKLDDRWTDSTELEDLTLAARWHYLSMIQFCSRTAKYDGHMRATDARRCSDVEDPAAALAALDEANLIHVDGKDVHVLRIEEHVPPPSIRENSAKSKVRMQRARKHKNGDHSMCLAEHCDRSPNQPVTGDVTRNTRTGQDGTGQARTGRTSASSSERTSASQDDVGRDDSAAGSSEQDFSSWPHVEPGTGEVLDGASPELTSDRPDGFFRPAEYSAGPRYCVIHGCRERAVEGGNRCGEHLPVGVAPY